jgi:hypothetical protein
MKRPSQLLSTACLALLCCADAVPCLAAEPELPVLAQDLKKLRAPGKVGSVLWTRRADQYTLQIVFPRSYRNLSLVDGRRVVMQPVQASPQAAPQALTEAKKQELQAPVRKNPVVQAWLLKADGTLIAAARRRVSISGQSSGSLPDEVLYSIPLLAGQEAVAVALMIDNEYYIETLKPFGNEKT